MLEVQTEQVLVVPTELFRRLGYFQGFSKNVDHYLDQLFDAQHTSYRPRHEVEQDPSFKQLIPYVIFRHIDSAGTPHVFQYTRGKGQGEGRLHSKCSVGVGGHISSDDGSDGRVPYQVGMRREVAEEVVVGSPYAEQCVGLINDDESDVGQVHLGVVHIFDVEEPDVQPREADIIEASFQPVSALLADLSRFETWSQICLRALFG